MSFAFSQVQPETNGNVTDMEVPVSKYLGASIDEALHATPTAEVYRWSELNQEEQDTTSPKLTAERANSLYGIGDLRFNEPITEGAASLLHDRKAEEMDRQFLLANDNHNVFAGAVGMTTGMLAQMVDPVNLALMFFPIVGEATKLGPVTEIGALGRGGFIREKIAEGVITRSALEKAIPSMPQLAESVIQGAGFMTLAELPKQLLANEHEEVGNPIFNIAQGVAFAGAIHLGLSSLGHVWAKVSDSTKQALYQKAMDQFVKGEDTNVVPLALTDNTFAEEQVAAQNAFITWDKETGWEAKPPQPLTTEVLQKKIANIFHQMMYDLKGHTFAQVNALKRENELLQTTHTTSGGENPVIPSTDPEFAKQAYSSVLEEIRQKGARTKEQIQQLFPESKLTREEAAALRKAAWNEIEVKDQHQQNTLDYLQKLQDENNPEKRMGAKRKARLEAERNSIPAPVIEEQAHNVDVPADSTISAVEKQTTEVKTKVDKEIKAKRIDKPETIGKRSGFTLRPAIEYAGMTPEQVAMMPKQPLHFTDLRPGSPTEGLSIALPEGSTLKDLNAAIKQKVKEGYEPIKTTPTTPKQTKVYGGLFILDPDFWQQSFGKNSYIVQDAKSIYNTMRNKLGADSGTWKMIDTQAFRDFMKGQLSPQQVSDWLHVNGQKVLSSVYGFAKAKANDHYSQIKAEYDALQHEFFETLPQRQQDAIDEYLNVHRQRGALLDFFSESEMQTVDKFVALDDEINQIDSGGTSVPNPGDEPVATSYYKELLPSSTDEPMPDWTTTKDANNIQRVDAHLPFTERFVKGDKYTADTLQIDWEPDGLHENLPDTVAWNAIQYHTGPNGEHIANIVELQSRWAQQVHTDTQTILASDPHYAKYGIAFRDKDGNMVEIDHVQLKEAGFDRGLFLNQHSPIEERNAFAAWAKNKANARAMAEVVNYAKDNVILREHQRLALKLAIEQARKEGATHIALSDAETVMMTEKHDAQQRQPDPQRTIEIGGHSYQARQGSSAYKDFEVPALRGKKVPNNPFATLTGNIRISPGASREYNRVLFEGKPHDGPADFWTAYPPTGPGGRAWKSIFDEVGYKDFDSTPLYPDPAWRPSQEGGMRLNYDQKLPKMLEELTGHKGKLVTIGEHKNAFEKVQIESSPKYTGNSKLEPRTNLIFKNADGTPKTTSTSRMYPIKNAREDFSFLGRDKAVINEIEKADEIKPQPKVIESAADCIGKTVL